MKKTARTLMAVVILAGLLAGRPAVVRAFPPLPSSFYGAVKLNDANLADGALVEAIINDQVYASTLTQTYQGDSVYSLDIPGDDLATDSVEGGKDGATISFRVAGILTGQTAAWRSGTNVRLDLTASSTSTPLPSQPTVTPPPTQTPIPAPPAAAAPTSTPVPIAPATASATATPPAGASGTSTPEETAVPTLLPAASVQSPTPPGAADSPVNAAIAPAAAETSPAETAPAETASPAPSGAPAVAENVLAPSGDAQTPPAGASGSLQPILAGRAEPAAAETHTSAAARTEPMWLLWAGAALVFIAALASIAWYLLRQKGGA